ncbi:hypothetical protein ACIBJF_44730 [Streptomyces sp. NPDC050743]|uniref:hypothetical protein n=1 Tax=Streptomyces sp. NPDC050743 TaxID=3365634 RepID=UPI0037AB2740
MTRAAPGPHPLTPAALPDGADWWHGCPHCHLPIQGRVAGLAAHRSTVHSRSGDVLSEEAPQNPTPTDFIYLVERVRDVLATASVGCLQQASENLDSAVTYLTDALTSPPSDQRSLLAWARTHLRDAIEATR